jgi:hypothetical protein
MKNNESPPKKVRNEEKLVSGDGAQSTTKRSQHFAEETEKVAIDGEPLVIRYKTRVF